MLNIHGQPRVVAQVNAFIKRPESRAFLLHGPTGTGKTTTAYHIADALQCDRSSPVSGFIEIASGDQNADAVRDIARSMRLRPMVGDWRVIVVNEADRMTAAGEVCWLDILEKLPAKCVVIFTTNNPDKLTQRFRDRCRSLEFVADARSVREFVRKEWSRRMGDAPIPADLSAAGCLNGSPSYRAALQEIEIAIECADLDLSGPPRLIVHTSDRVWGVFSADEQSDAERMQSALAKEMPGFNFYLSESRTECAPGQVPPADCAALVA